MYPCGSVASRRGRRKIGPALAGSVWNNRARNVTHRANLGKFAAVSPAGGLVRTQQTRGGKKMVLKRKKQRASAKCAVDEGKTCKELRFNS